MKLRRGAKIFISLITIFSVIYYFIAVLSIDILSSRFLGLNPGPDAHEYFSGAINIIREGYFGIKIGNEMLPSRYPPGFSIFLVPFVYFKNHIITAPFFANGILGLGIIIWLFVFFSLQKKYLAAGLSTALVATLPSFITYSRSPLSENLGAFLILMVFTIIYWAIKKHKVKWFYLAAFLMGLGISTRLSLIFFAPILSAIFFFPPFNIKNFLKTGLVLLIGMSPLLHNNWTNFGNLFLTGYEFWVPHVESFKLNALPNHLYLLWNELTLNTDQFSVANIFATGVHFTPAYFIIMLISVSSLMGSLTKERKLFLGSGLLYVFIMSFYFHASLRMYYPLQILAIPLIADFYQKILEKYKFDLKNISIVVISVFFLLIIIGFPSKSGYKGTKLSMQSIDLLNKEKFHGVNYGYESLVKLIPYLGNEKALVIVQTRSIVSILASSLLPKQITVLPEDDNHLFNGSKEWVLDQARINKLIKQDYIKDVSIYYVGINGGDLKALNNLKKIIPFDKWKILDNDKTYLVKLN